jgi:threonine/homoserine/homoserine lactone efflux protein
VVYFPQFLRPGRPVALQVVLLGAIYVTIAVASDSVYVLVSSSLAARVGRSARATRRLARFSAVTYCALGVAALLAGDRHTMATVVDRS